MRREFRPAVRQAALVRAGYRCELCGSRERLELHHIGNRQDRSAFNAMVLCVRCHAKLHAVASVWELGTIVPDSPGAAACRSSQPLWWTATASVVGTTG